MAACEALTHSGQRAVNEMKREYFRRREYIVSELNRIGLYCAKPDGAFYVFASVKNTGLAAIDFASKLLKQQKVAVVPGAAFGKDCDDYVRISYASSLDNLREAVARIEKFLAHA